MMKKDEAVALTQYGWCALVGCLAPLYIELTRCADLTCAHNLICFDCAGLFDEVAKELLATTD